MESADLRLEPEKPENGIEHRLRLQRRAGVVEMDHAAAPRRLRPHARDIDHRGPPNQTSTVQKKGSPRRHGEHGGALQIDGAPFDMRLRRKLRVRIVLLMAV